MNDNLLSADVDTWPVDTVKITTAAAHNAAAAAQGANAKGLKALEFLLFDRRGNAAAVATYSGTGPDAASRRAYLASVAAALKDVASTLSNAWANGYTSTFATATGNDVSSSVSLLVNSISFCLDQAKNMKVGNAIGMGVKVNDNQPHPDQIEYRIAEASLPVMRATVASMKAVFDGGGTGAGLRDILDHVNAERDGQKLSTVIDKAFSDALLKIDAVAPPYGTSVTTQPAQVKSVYTALKLLIAYFKVDVANNLGVTITFTDADGD